MLSSVLVLILLFSCAPLYTEAKAAVQYDDNNVQTDSLLLINADTHEILYSRNPREKRPIASVTKLMTCILALEHIENPETYMITIKEQPIYEIITQNASTAGFQNFVGISFSALDLLYGLMLPSGCEVAQVLAYEIGKTPSNFAKMMTAKAKELGCKNTYFAEPHGVTDKNYSTAEDLAIIAEYALENPLFREIVSTECYQPKHFSYPFYNTNRLIREEYDNGSYNKYVIGVKTGSTTRAGYCLVSAAEKGDDLFICVALGADYNAPVNYATRDTSSLYDWALNNHTENVYIDIERDFASVDIGKKLAIDAKITDTTEAADSTSDEAEILWHSSDESVATVDKYGVVYGVGFGQAKITATTSTGNFDTLKVSVGFYNGITLTSRDGDYTSGSKKAVNWDAVKNSGFDFAVIRAGWGSEYYPEQNDPQFVYNVKGAVSKKMPFYLSFIAYAQSEAEAVREAEYFLREMKDYFPKAGKDYLVSVIYDMTYDTFSENSKKLNTNIALAFANKLKASGYSTIICADRSVADKLDTAMIKKQNVGIYYRHYPYFPDFSEPTKVSGKAADMWEFRNDKYYLPASQSGYATLCVSYDKPLYNASSGNKGLLGDANSDEAVNIRDATYIQKAVAGIVALTEEENLRADTNLDKNVNVRDATLIQKHLAGIETNSPVGERIS